MVRLTTPVPGEQSVKFPNSPLGNVVPGDPGVPSTISPTRGMTLDLALVSPGRLRAASWHCGPDSVFAHHTGSTTWALRITVISASLEMLPGGLYWGSPTADGLRKPLHQAARPVSPKGTKFPLTPFPSGPGAGFRTLSSET